MSQETLEDFALKGLDLGRLTGVSLAVHAIPDGFLLLHCGVGCKHKATTQLSTHDRARGVVQREGWTEVGDAELIEGASHRVGPYLRSWYARQQPGVMAVCSVTFLDLTGEDLAEEVRKAAESVPCAVLSIPAPGYDGDLWAGYASAVLEACRTMDFASPPSAARTVSVLGHLFTRYEGDETGNLDHLRALVQGMGLVLGPVLLSGAPWAELQGAAASEVLVVTPYMAPVRKRLSRVIGEKKGERTVLDLDLPMGLAGTRRWLSALAAATQSDAGPVLAAWEPRARTEVEKASTQLRGRTAAIFAELPLLVGWVGLCRELGMVPTLVGLRGHSLGGEEELRAALARCDLTLPTDTEVLVHPSLARIRDCIARRPPQYVLGAATELNALHWAGHAGLLGLEIGFPCRDHHVDAPRPFLGYAGVVCQTRRLLRARPLGRMTEPRGPIG